MKKHNSDWRQQLTSPLSGVLSCGKAGRRNMELIFKSGAVEIWAVTESYGTDYYVYGIRRDPVVCPSLGMAKSMAAAA